jgi:chromosome partitioning protein
VGVVTIAIANNKGGTGKTTTAVTLATGLAARDYRVLLVDTDAQGHVALYLGLEPADDVFRLLIAELPIAECIVYANGHAHGSRRLAVVRSGEKTTVAKTVLGAQRAPVDVLARALDPLRDALDFCLVDAAPSIDPLGLATLYVADYVLVPAKCETLSLDGIRRIAAAILDLHQTYKASTRLLGVLPTMVRAQTLEHRINLRAMAEAYGRLVYPPIPQATAVAESTAYQEPLWTYAPDHPATAAYQRVLERMLDDVQG